MLGPIADETYDKNINRVSDCHWHIEHRANQIETVIPVQTIADKLVNPFDN